MPRNKECIRTMDIIDELGSKEALHDSRVTLHSGGCVPCMSYLNAGLRLSAYSVRQGNAGLSGRIAQEATVPARNLFRPARIAALALSALVLAGVFIGSLQFRTPSVAATSIETAARTVVTGEGYHPENSELELVYAIAMDN